MSGKGAGAVFVLGCALVVAFILGRVNQDEYGDGVAAALAAERTEMARSMDKPVRIIVRHETRGKDNVLILSVSSDTFMHGTYEGGRHTLDNAISNAAGHFSDKKGKIPIYFDDVPAILRDVARERFSVNHDCRFVD